jgi:hypothetical protein
VLRTARSQRHQVLWPDLDISDCRSSSTIHKRLSSGIEWSQKRQISRMHDSPSVRSGVQRIVSPVPSSFVLVQIEGHTHLCVDKHRERRSGSQMIEIGRLAETVDVGRDL